MNFQKSSKLSLPPSGLPINYGGNVLGVQWLIIGGIGVGNYKYLNFLISVN